MAFMMLGGSDGLAGVFEQHAHSTDCSDRIDHVLARVLGAEPPIGSYMLTPPGSGLIVRQRPHRVHPESWRQIGDDIAKHIRRHNHVVEFWRLYKPHAASIDVVVVGLHIGIIPWQLLGMCATKDHVHR